MIGRGGSETRPCSTRAKAGRSKTCPYSQFSQPLKPRWTPWLGNEETVGKVENMSKSWHALPSHCPSPKGRGLRGRFRRLPLLLGEAWGESVSRAGNPIVPRFQPLPVF